MKSIFGIGVVLVAAVLLQACSGGEPVSEDRYAGTDEYIARITANIEADSALELVADIDHSRLGHAVGSPMPPSRVVIFSDSELESELIMLNPLAALEMPLRVLAFESGEGNNKVTFNSFDYLASRYEIDGDKVSGLAQRYAEAIDKALSGIPEGAVVSFDNDGMQPDGIITIDSPYDFEETIEKVRAAIDAQDDTISFGTVDFQANAKNDGIDILPAYMILFGAPGPGGKAMADAPTLGLDGFGQKFLIWQDKNGVTHLSFNDLLALAKRQQVSIPVVLRLIDFRLNRVFNKALEAG